MTGAVPVRGDRPATVARPVTTVRCITIVRYVTVGDATHGVVRHGLTTARTLAGLPGLDVEVRNFPDAAAFSAAREELAALAKAGSVLHLDVTDSLFGPDAGAAADVLCATLPPAATVTLHDVPQPGEGAARFERRARAYARVASHVAGVVVSSEHERALLGDIVDVPARVVPLPVPDAAPAAEAGTEAGDPPLPEGMAGLEDDVVVLGFLYPGKGHTLALDALARLHAAAPHSEAGAHSAAGAAAGSDTSTVGARPLPRRVTALGRVAQGHDALVDELTAAASASGLEFRVTGYVPDEVLPAALRAAGIPFAAHHNVSASGSLAAWTAHGRRALTPRGRYTSEMERLRPGTLDLVEPGGDLVAASAAAIGRAAADPSRTRLAPGTSLEPGARACARALVEAWESLGVPGDPGR